MAATHHLGAVLHHAADLGRPESADRRRLSSRTGARPHAPPASSASGSLPPWGAAQRLVLRQDAGTDQRVPRAPVFRIHARDKPNETVIFIIANTTRD